MMQGMNWGGWGWRDLASDGKYIYAGDPNVPYIVQIDPSNGQPTGTQYGPFPITPCRALAYDPVSDCFWTGSFSSSIYQCFRDNTYNTFSGQGHIVGVCRRAHGGPRTVEPARWPASMIRQPRA